MSDRKLHVDEITIGPTNGAHLTLSPHGIGLFHANGGLQARLRCNEGRPDLTLYDTNEQARVSVYLRPDGTPAFKLCDGNGTERLGGTVLSTGQPVLGFFDAMDGQRLELTLDGHIPSIAFHDEGGDVLLEVSPHSLVIAEPQDLFIIDGKGNRVPWVPIQEETKR